MTIYQGRDRLPVREAILHCAAFVFPRPPHDAASVRDVVRGWHLARGWKNIGYHYVVMPNGEVAAGRPLDQIGAHTMGRNRGTIGILLCERRNVTKLGNFADYFTEWQMGAVRGLIEMHGIEWVSGHNDWAAKLCPGFRVRAADLGASTPPDLRQ